MASGSSHPNQRITRRHRRRRPTGLPVGNRSHVGFIDLEKAGGRIAYRSGNERDGLIRLGMDAAIESIERNDLSATERIEFNAAGQQPSRGFTLPDGSTYTPDLRVRVRGGGLVYIEMGPHAEKKEPATAARLEMAGVEIRKSGADFVVLTERSTRGRELENLRRLLGRLRPISAAPELVEAAASAFRTTPVRLSVPEVVELVAPGQPGAPADVIAESAWAAIARAAQRGELVYEIDVLEIDASSAFGIATEASSLRSWFERVLDGQHEDEAPEFEPSRTPLATPMVRTLELELSKEDRDEYQRRLQIARDRVASPQLTWAELAARHNVSARRARYYCNEWEDYGEEELRPHQRKCTGPRVHEDLLVLIDTLWRDPRKLGLKAILQHPEMRARCKELGSKISYDQLWRYTRQLRRDRVAIASRDGKRAPTPHAFGPVDPMKKPTVPLQVIQVDGARSDVFVLSRDGKHVLERPWILWAIDVATRCVWSWSVCEDTPTEVDYLKLVRRGILPKDDLVRACGAANPYPVHGIPQLILADRGWQFASMRSRERLGEIGVIVEHAAPYRPDMKGHVERLIRTINERYFHRQHGTSLSSVHHRGGYNAVAAAKKHGLRIDTFEAQLGQVVIDGYSQEPHSAIKCTPVEQWEKLVAKYGPVRAWPSDPSSALQLSLFALRDGGTRTRDQRGYFFHNVIYRPASHQAPQDARILYDPEDMRTVSILDAATGVYACEATALGLSGAVAVSLGELQKAAKVVSKPTTGTDALTDLVEANEGELSKRQATRVEKAIRAAQERRVADPVSAILNTAESDVADEVTADATEIDLDPLPDFEDAA